VRGPRRASWPTLDPDLTAELAAGDWDHPWELAPAVHARAQRPSARHENWTLERMLAPFARDAFALGTRRTVLDLRCGDGWLAHRMIGRGARRVVGLDDRPDRLRRARLLRDHFAIDESVLELRAPEEPLPTQGEAFDLVLLVGPSDREPDEGHLRTIREMTGHVFAIECPGRQTVATAEAALRAGFTPIERIRPPLQGAPRHVLGERELLVAIPGARG
jgi:SAM-dependent methyltransferase